MIIELILMFVCAMICVILGGFIAFFCYRQGLKDGKKVNEGQDPAPIIKKENPESNAEADAILEGLYGRMNYNPYDAIKGVE